MTQLNDAVLALMILVLIAVALKVFSTEARMSALSRIEGKLDVLMRHAGLEYAPSRDLSDAVRDAMQRGEKIQAIKLYREATGVGLKEAKDAIEAAERGMKSS